MALNQIKTNDQSLLHSNKARLKPRLSRSFCVKGRQTIFATITTSDFWKEPPQTSKLVWWSFPRGFKIIISFLDQHLQFCKLWGCQIMISFNPEDEGRFLLNGMLFAHYIPKGRIIRGLVGWRWSTSRGSKRRIANLLKKKKQNKKRLEYMCLERMVDPVFFHRKSVKKYV